MFPRRYFFEQACGVIAASGRSIPIFTDKHLAYNWTDALWMYERAKELQLPFMAGSSAPLFWRNPVSAAAPFASSFDVKEAAAQALELQPESPLQEALCMSFGSLEGYGYHGLGEFDHACRRCFPPGCVFRPMALCCRVLADLRREAQGGRVRRERRDDARGRRCLELALRKAR